MRSREESGFDAQQEAPRGSVIGLLLGLCLSVAVHVAFLGVILFAPSRLPSMSAPSAYTVELVNPGAVGGQLLAGKKTAVKKAAKKPKVSEVKTAAVPKRVEKKVVKPKARKLPPSQARAKKPPPKKKPALKSKAKVTKAKHAAKGKQKTLKVTKAVPIGKSRRKVKKKVPAAAKPAARPPKAQAASPRKASRQSGSGLDQRLAAAVKRAGGAGTGQGGDKKGLKGPATIGPGEGPGGGGKVRGLEFLVYYNAMLSRIKDSWAWVGTGRDLKVRVRFGIQENGEIGNIRLTESSGDRGYDQSVLRAVRRVRRLDPPPAKYRRDFGDVELEFRPGDLEQRG